MHALLTDGSTVEVGPAQRQDFEAVRAMHAALSPDNMYLRFFSMSPAAAEQEARRICREPDADHAALLAWQDGRLAGVGAYELSGKPGVAEVAFAVPDDMHGRGIASLLLEHLVWRARQRGLTAFLAETLAENSAMLRVFADAGLPARRRIADGVVELTFPLPVGQEDYRLGSYLEAVASRESRADVASLRPLLQPRSVAVVGASRRRATVGRAILRNIVTGGFAGPVYAVNPRAPAPVMEGVPCVASVEDLPGPVDLAVIAVPPPAVPGVAEQCGRHGVRALIVISESRGAAGAELKAVCRRYGMRLVGPSCFGVIMPWIGLDATFTAGHPVRGVAGLMVQSGGVGIALLEQMSRLGIGVSSFASAGDKYDVSPTDLLTWWAQDEVTQLAVLYVESFGNPRKFAGAARRVAQRMPVLTVIGARSPAGHRAASHTAAAATPLASQEAMFDLAGVIATRSLGELVDTAALLACQPLPAGNRVAIIANAGGAAALAADACADHGLQVVRLGAATRRALRRCCRGCGGDRAGGHLRGGDDGGLPGLRGGGGRRRRGQRSPRGGGAHGVLRRERRGGRGGPQQAARGRPARPGRVRARLKRRPSPSRRPTRRGHRPGSGPAAAGQATAIIDVRRRRSPGCPVTPTPTSGPRAGPRGPLPGLARTAARQGPRAGRAAHGRRARHGRRVPGRLAAGGWLPQASAAELVSCYGVPLVVTIVAASEEEAAAAAAQLGGRVVLKAEAEGLVHRTGTGGIRVDRHPAGSGRGLPDAGR